MKLEYTLYNARHGKYKRQWWTERIAWGIFLVTFVFGIIGAVVSVGVDLWTPAMRTTETSEMLRNFGRICLSMTFVSVLIAALVVSILALIKRNTSKEKTNNDNEETIRSLIPIIEESYEVTMSDGARHKFAMTLSLEESISTPERLGEMWYALEDGKMLPVDALWTVNGVYKMNEPSELSVEFYIEDGILYDEQYRKLVPGEGFEKQLIDAGVSRPVIPLKVDSAEEALLEIENNEEETKEENDRTE